MARESLDWKWVGIGILILLVVQVALNIVFTVFGLLTLGFGFILFIVAKPIAYFLGGLLTGYVSPGVTIREPAVSAVIIAVAGIIFDASRGGILGIIVSGVVALFLAIAGAQIGERMQRGKA